MAKFYQISPTTPLITEPNSELDSKVDKVPGKGLSTKDFTKNYRNKLNGIDENAEVNVNPDWNATSGDAMILNKPTDITDLSAHSLTELSDYANVIADISGATLTVGPGLSYYYNPSGNIGYLENTGILTESDPVFSFSPAATITQTQIDTWDAGALGGTVTSFSAGDLSPLFTTSEANPTTTPALSFSLSNAAANTYFGNATGSSAAPSYTAAAALTKVDDTNVTLTLGGAPSTSLLTATSLTLGWTGTLADSRLSTTTVTPGSYTLASITVSSTGRITSASDGDTELISLAGLGITQGDLVYGSAADTYTKLAKDINATRYLSNTGTSNNPAWAQIDLTNGVTGDLPFSNLTQIAGLSVLGVTGSSTADVAAITAGSDFQVLRRSGSNVAFGQVNLASSNAVTGILPSGNGGTGNTTFGGANRIAYASSATALTNSANFTYDGTTLAIATNANANTDSLTLRNSNAGSSAVTSIRLWNDSSSASNRGLQIELPSAAFTSPYAGSATYWLYENASQIWATNNAFKMILNASGNLGIGTTSPQNKLDVEGGAVIGVSYSGTNTAPSNGLLVQGNVGIGTTSTSNALEIVGTMRLSSSTQDHTNFTTSTNIGRIISNAVTNSGFSLRTGGTERWVMATYIPTGTNPSFTFYNASTSQASLFIHGDTDFASFGNVTSPEARLHIKGSGATSSTKALLVENSSGTDMLTVRNDGSVYIGSSTPNAASILQADSTTQGFLPPRMTTTQRDAITSPPAGLIIYNTTTSKLNVYTSTWEQITSA